jgi:hypothetical protein
MSQQVYASERDAIGKPFIDQRVTKLEAMVFPGPSVAGKLAFYDGAGDLTDANISVTGAANDLTFDHNTTLFVDNIQSTDGDLNLGGGVTNLITFASSDAITMDATNSITLGHAGFTVTIVDKLDVLNIDTSVIDSSGSLIIGPTAPNIVIGVAGSDVTIVDGAPFEVQNINNPVALTIGDTTPNVNIGKTGGNININDNSIMFASVIDHATNAFLYNTCPFINFGGSGGSVQFNGGINFALSGSSALTYYNEWKEFAMQASGPFVAQPAGWYSIQRINTIATLVIKWLGPSVLATATSPMLLTPPLPLAFYPMSVEAFACQVRKTGALFELGTVAISTTGDLTVVPSATNTFTIGDNCDFNTICVSYELTI